MRKSETKVLNRFAIIGLVTIERNKAFRLGPSKKTQTHIYGLNVKIINVKVNFYLHV